MKIENAPSVEGSTEQQPRAGALGLAIGSPPWRPGNWAIRAVVGGPSHVYVMAVGEKYIDILTHDGVPTSERPGTLLSVAGYIEHADRMRDEWTGKEYRENIERARRVPPLHPDWPKWLAFASEPLANNVIGPHSNP